MESTGSHEDSKEGEGTEEGDTLTPPATNSPGSTVVTLTNISSAVSTKSLPSSTILGHVSVVYIHVLSLTCHGTCPWLADSQ